MTSLSLREVDIHMGLSQETFCFTATVCGDGVPLFTAENDGHGGANFYRGDRALIAEAISLAAEITGESFEPLDQLIAYTLSAIA